MAPKKAVIASSRKIRAVKRVPKANCDGHGDDLSSASANKVAGSANKSASKGSHVGNRSKAGRGESLRPRNRSVSSSEASDLPESIEPIYMLRSRTTEETDRQTASSNEVSECARSTVVTSEGRESATQRSDVRGREAGENANATKGSQSCKNRTRSQDGLVNRSRAARLNLAPASESGQCERQRLTLSPAKAAHFVCERAEREHRSDHMAYRQKVSTCPEEAEQAHSIDRGGCARMHAQRPFPRERHRESSSVDGRHSLEHHRASPSVELRHPYGRRQVSPPVERRHALEYHRASPSVGGRHSRGRLSRVPFSSHARAILIRHRKIGNTTTMNVIRQLRK